MFLLILLVGRSGDRIPVGAIFSAPVQTGPGAHQHPIKWVPGTLPGDKATGAWRWPSAPSNAEVKKRVELYPYSPYGPSSPVLGWTSPLPPFEFLTWRNVIYLPGYRLQNISLLLCHICTDLLAGLFSNISFLNVKVVTPPHITSGSNYIICSHCTASYLTAGCVVSGSHS